MSNLNKQIKDLQNFDGLAEAEKLTGASYKENDSTAIIGMGLHFAKNKQMKELMELTNDTCFSETEESYLAKVISFGFEVVLKQPFIGRKEIEERFYILWHKKYSILLVFDTYTGSKGSKPSRNGGYIYYNWSPNEGIGHSSFTSSGGFIGFNFKSDLTEELKYSSSFENIKPSKIIVLNKASAL